MLTSARRIFLTQGSTTFSSTSFRLFIFSSESLEIRNFVCCGRFCLFIGATESWRTCLGKILTKCDNFNDCKIDLRRIFRRKARFALAWSCSSLQRFHACFEPYSFFFGEKLPCLSS